MKNEGKEVMNNIKNSPCPQPRKIIILFFSFFIGIEFDLPFQGIRQKNFSAAASPLETEGEKDTEIMGKEIEEYVIYCLRWLKVHFS